MKLCICIMISILEQDDRSDPTDNYFIVIKIIIIDDMQVPAIAIAID